MAESPVASQGEVNAEELLYNEAIDLACEMGIEEDDSTSAVHVDFGVRRSDTSKVDQDVVGETQLKDEHSLPSMLDVQVSDLTDEHLNILNVTDQHKVDVIQNSEDEASIPSVFVDSLLLPSGETNIDEKVEKTNCTVYDVNGTVFRDVEGNAHRDDELVQFEVKQLRDEDILGATAIRDEDKSQLDRLKQTPDIGLEVSTQDTPYGVIINSSILLTENAWNTIVSDNHTKCVACDRNLELEEIKSHITTDGHTDVLNNLKPLAKFDLNIVRKINDKYHCGICNVIFDVDESEHLESHSHGQKMLTSINKLSDIMNDFDIYRKYTRNRDNDCIHFSVNTIVDDGNFGSDIDHETRNESNDCVNYYVEDSSGIDSESFDELNDDCIWGECYSDNGNDPDPAAVSYADMAKKPKTFETPKYVQIKVNDKRAKVQFDCWNMIIALKNNTYYCMACKQNGPIRYKIDHCVEANHVENLMRCSIVTDFKEHVVRKVNDMYHCAHCNNLQMIQQMPEHIENMHMKRSATANINLVENSTLTNPIAERATASPKSIDANIADSNKKSNATPKPVDNNIAERNINIRNENTSILDNAIKNIDNENITRTCSSSNAPNGNGLNNRNDGNAVQRNTEIKYNESVASFPHVVPTEMDTIVIREFGQSFRVSLLSYHLVQKRPTDFYCHLCQVQSSNSVIWHHITKEMKHANMLLRTPFWPPMGVHLMRQTVYGFHCLICNVMVQNTLHHTYEPMHTYLLNRVLGLVPSRPILIQTGPPIFYQNRPIMVNNSIVETERNSTNQKAEKNIKLHSATSSNKALGQIGNRDNETKCAITERVLSNERNVETTIGLTDNVITKTVVMNDVITETGGSDNVITETKNELFDVEQFVYVKVKNIYAKITLTSYNGLVPIGTGYRYCFLCSTVVFENLSTHIRSKGHMQSIRNNKFLEKYEKHLLRQISSSYHCAICNVLITKKFLPEHLSWAPHNENESHKIVKSTRRNEIKSGVKEITCATQKEIVTKDKDTEWKIVLNIEIRQSAQYDIVKKKKIVKIDDIVLKISWDAFHGVSKKKNGYKCNICQVDFKNYELAMHIESSQHANIFDDCFMLEFTPNLIRKVNDTILHCLTCNAEVASDYHGITDHIGGKRHVKQFKMIVDSSDTDISDSDDILTLKSVNFDKKRKSF